MAVWMCADMLMVLFHQLFGKRGVIATPASCFQGGVLCVYPQATIKTSRKPRFNHRRRSPSNRNTLLPTLWLRYQKSGPKQHRLITKAWGSQWPDCDPRNYSLYQSCASSSCPRRLGGQEPCGHGTRDDGLICRAALLRFVRTLGRCPASADVCDEICWRRPQPV